MLAYTLNDFSAAMIGGCKMSAIKPKAGFDDKSSRNLGLDIRKMKILSVVVDEYIKTGEPIGSNAVMQHLDVTVSSATIRNDMAYLEKLGLLEQPHTSAGRIPTCIGYRFYIDNLMSPKPLNVKERRLIDSLLSKDEFQTADAVIDNAVNLLSDLTQLAVVSKNNTSGFSVITRVEVIPAGRRLYALLIITSAGTIKNKICRIEFDLSNEQLTFFANFINDHLFGINIENLSQDMLSNLAMALGTYMMSLSPLLHAVYELGEEIVKTNVSLKGEQNLIAKDDFKSEELVKLLTHKNDLESLLESAFDGVSVVFGKENESFAVTNSSMILAPYKIGEKQGGSLGVIGPMRIDYAKIIPHLEYISNRVAKLLTNAIDCDQNGLRKEEIESNG